MLVTVVIGSIIFSKVSEGPPRRPPTRSRASSAYRGSARRPEGTPTTNPDGTPLPDDGIPHFKTDKERAEAALKELDAFVATSGNPLRMEGRLQRGPPAAGARPRPRGHHGLRGDPERQASTIACASSRARASGTPRSRRATWPPPIATFEKLTTTPPSSRRAASTRTAPRYHKARIAELRGNAETPKKLYREVLDKNPTTSLRDEITNRLAVLELK